MKAVLKRVSRSRAGHLNSLQETTKSRMLWQLDPSRNPAAEGEYSQYLQWHKASETLFAHEAISDHFIHGRHEGVSVATTIQQIVDGVVRGEDFPASCSLLRKRWSV